MVAPMAPAPQAVTRRAGKQANERERGGEHGSLTDCATPLSSKPTSESWRARPGIASAARSPSKRRPSFRCWGRSPGGAIGSTPDSNAGRRATGTSLSSGLPRRSRRESALLSSAWQRVRTSGKSSMVCANRDRLSTVRQPFTLSISTGIRTHSKPCNRSTALRERLGLTAMSAGQFDWGTLSSLMVAASVSMAWIQCAQ